MVRSKTFAPMWMPSCQSPPHPENAAVTWVTAAGRGGENLRNRGILRLTQMWSHIHDMFERWTPIKAQTHDLRGSSCGTSCRYPWLRGGCLSAECSARGHFNCWEMSRIITVRGIFFNPDCHRSVVPWYGRVHRTTDHQATVVSMRMFILKCQYGGFSRSNVIFLLH